MFEPGYVGLLRSGALGKRVAEAVASLECCRLCPRDCAENRLAGERGFCRTGRLARVASFSPHFGEERPLVGRHGSGTIFFSSCNLLCTFCQNYDISHGHVGGDVTAAELAEMMLHLADAGCHNINFVTPTHVVPQILEGLLIAAERGLRIPLVYNTGGYDSTETLRLLDGVMDIYMPDLKFWDNDNAQRYCTTPDYRERASAAVTEMHRQVGDLVMDDAGIALRGLLVRHLVMPDDIAGTPDVMRFLATEISSQTYVNVMAQYRPCGSIAPDDPAARCPARKELAAAIAAARATGITRLDGVWWPPMRGM